MVRRCYRGFAAVLLAPLLLLVIGGSVAALAPSRRVRKNKQRIVIHVGTPKLWTLDQAHDRLTTTYNINHGLLETMGPCKGLRLKGFNTPKTQLLRSMLDVEGLVNQNRRIDRHALKSEREERTGSTRSKRTRTDDSGMFAAKAIDGPSSLEDMKSNTIGRSSEPRSDTSMTLDDCLSMQYEMIAKQLTILRDEVSPDERVLFLELPTFLSAPPCKSNDYFALVQWKVLGAWASAADMKDAKAANLMHGTFNAVRVLNIIPGQCAQCLDDIQGAIVEKNVRRSAKRLRRLGVISKYREYKRQYQQRLWQVACALGISGSPNAFGWIFRPAYGSQHIARGARTTYAVLAVPKGTSALSIQATGIGGRGKKAVRLSVEMPDYLPGSNNNKELVLQPTVFQLVVPNYEPQHCEITNISYSPVKKGAEVTMLVSGNQLPAQTAVLVDGVLLSNLPSDLNSPPQEPSNEHASVLAVNGWFRVISSRELLMRFSMTDRNYVGTPTIAVISPEESIVLNFLPVIVNCRPVKTSLMASTATEPMFFDSLRPEQNSRNRIKLKRSRR